LGWVSLCWVSLGWVSLDRAGQQVSPFAATVRATIKLELKKRQLAAGDRNARLTDSLEQRETVLDSLRVHGLVTGLNAFGRLEVWITT
jgi:hypothetical protein